MRYIVFAGLALANPAVLSAEPLSFEAALHRASTEAPSLQAGDAQIEASRSDAIAADRLPDPSLDVGIRDFPVTGPDAGRFNRDDFTTTTVGISQMFVNPAKRRARAGRAGAEIEIAESEFAVELQSVRIETAVAWIDLYYAKRRLAQLDLLNASLDDLQATVSARLAAGAARPSQALEPEQLRAAIVDRRSELFAEVARARSLLVRYTGDPDADVAGDPPAIEIDNDMLLAGIGTLPRLRLIDAQASAADADIRLARAELHPNWTVSAAYGRREPAFGDLVSVGVSIDLPLFTGRRQDPRITARISEANRVRFDRLAVEREVRAALEGDLADHSMHHQRLDNARTTLVPLARRRAELDLASYGAGTLDLGSALMSSLALAEAEVDALAREAAVARDAIRITFTFGEQRP